MLEEAEDRAARAAVEGRPSAPVTRVAIRAGELFIGDFPVPYPVPVAQQQARKPLVIIESPYSGDVAHNTEYARSCLLDSLRRGEAPIASHLLHTQALDDMRPDERELGIEAGLAWYRAAEKCVVYEDLGISQGMAKGIDRARQHGVPVEYRHIGGVV
ncbi:hypothetical protein NJB93_20465 [Brucella intermedia]|uniref:DUF7768 domain-containing protein n=1 Tax=Brucella intermedia TaxID=94625 RepID=UPI00209B540E|nr:hypothetical protein [Brucella intermedia]MCO7728942.1 hypothetical protein [Brucella intermedia]